MPRKKKVSIMCFSSNNGGMEIDTIKLARLLSASCDVTILCKSGSFIHDELKKQKTIAYIPVRFSSRTFSFSMLFTVRRALKEHNIKNVIFFGASELKTLYFSFLWLDLNVLVRHGTTKSHKKSGLIHRIIYSCVNYHIALSEHLLRNIEYILPRTKNVAFKIIYPSFSYPAFDATCSDPEEKGVIRIIHVGRIAPAKGHEDAVLACRGLYEEKIDFELDFLGSISDDVYFQEIAKAIEALPYREKIKFHGHVNNVSEYFKQADVFLYPSYGEGFANVLAEAMGHGLRAITYNNTVFPEYLKMGFKLTIVEDRDITALSSGLLDLVITLNNNRCKQCENIALALKLFNSGREIKEWQRLLV